MRADQIDKSKHPRKKFNYFESEDDIVAQVRAATGLIEGVRHPLTFIMEACDDIAYCVLDVEDSVKKGMVSIYDAIAWLSHKSQGESSERKALVQRVITRTERDITKYREFGLSPSELNDAAMQKLRVHSIAEMVNAVIRRAEAAMPEMLQGSYDLPILQDSDGALLRDALQDFAREHAYKHRSVLEKELKGYKVITSLMEIFWNSIESRRKNTSGPFDRYVYGRISENYRRVAENTAGTLPAYYCDCRLLADMVAGMTDGFATDLYQELLEYR